MIEPAVVLQKIIISEYSGSLCLRCDADAQDVCSFSSSMCRYGRIAAEFPWAA